MGLPDSPTPLLSFVKETKEYHVEAMQEGPTVVHCRCVLKLQHVYMQYLGARGNLTLKWLRKGFQLEKQLQQLLVHRYEIFNHPETYFKH